MSHRTTDNQDLVRASSEIIESSRGDDTEPDDGEWLLELLRSYWEHRQFLIWASIIGFLISTSLAFLIPKDYTATTRLMPPDSQSSSAMDVMAALSSRGSGLGSLAGNLLGLKTSGDLFIGVMRSETSEDHLVQQFDLRRVYGARLIEDAAKRLDNQTTISEDRRSGIITISVTDRSPQRAAFLANGYVDELNSLIVGDSTSSAHRERIFLEQRLKTVKKALDDASNELAQFSSKNKTLDVQQQGRAMLDEAATLAGEVIAAQSQLQGLREIYTDSNPRVRALSARVTELRAQLDKLSGIGASNAIESDQSGDPKSDMPYPSLRELPLLGVKYANYYRRAKTEETVYELLTEQYELAKVQEAKDTPSVTVLDPARIPDRKSFPPRLLIMIAGTFLTFGVACLIVYLSMNWQKIPSADPRKAFAREIVATFKTQLSRAARNGSAHISGSSASTNSGGDEHRV